VRRVVCDRPIDKNTTAVVELERVAGDALPKTRAEMKAEEVRRGAVVGVWALRHLRPLKRARNLRRRALSFMILVVRGVVRELLVATEFRPYQNKKS